MSAVQINHTCEECSGHAVTVFDATTGTAYSTTERDDLVGVWRGGESRVTRTKAGELIVECGSFHLLREETCSTIIDLTDAATTDVTEADLSDLRRLLVPVESA